MYTPVGKWTGPLLGNTKIVQGILGTSKRSHNNNSTFIFNTQASPPTLIHAIRWPSVDLSYPNLASLAKTSGSNLIKNTVLSRCPFSISTLCAETRAGYKSQHGGREAWQEGGAGVRTGLSVALNGREGISWFLETAVACFIKVPANGKNTLYQVRSRLVSRAAWR